MLDITKYNLSAQLLNESQLADYLGVSKACLRKWRTERRGPPVTKVGGTLVRYRQDQLQAWLSEQPTIAATEETAV